MSSFSKVCSLCLFPCCFVFSIRMQRTLQNPNPSLTLQRRKIWRVRHPVRQRCEPGAGAAGGGAGAGNTFPVSESVPQPDKILPLAKIDLETEQNHFSRDRCRRCRDVLLHFSTAHPCVPGQRLQAPYGARQAMLIPMLLRPLSVIFNSGTAFILPPPPPTNT